MPPCPHANVTHCQKQITSVLGLSFPCLFSVHFQALKSKLCLCYACHSESDFIPSNFLKAALLFFNQVKMYVSFPWGGRSQGADFCIINGIDAGYSDTWKWDCNWVMAQLHQKEIQILTQGQQWGGRWQSFRLFLQFICYPGAGVTKNWWSLHSVQ